ncbi:MAG: hypothetical protein ACN4GZ_16905 [Acidimicrobiales bacterium]
MINDVFGLIATIFPTAVFLAIAVGLVLLGRTWSKISSGSIGAGPALVPTPVRHGLQRVPWDLQGVRQALSDQSPQPLTILLTRAHDLGISVRLPDSTDTVGRIESILDQLEAALELPPLEPSTPPPPEGLP